MYIVYHKKTKVVVFKNKYEEKTDSSSSAGSREVSLEHLVTPDGEEVMLSRSCQKISGVNLKVLPNDQR